MAATSGDKKIGKEKQTKQKNLNGEITAQLNRSYKKEIIMYTLCTRISEVPETPATARHH